ncbi:amidase [Cohnella abietis]|uniref:Amidase domain-containing protein n=1 Tax=Cohnella abietis TaxID=2507935 RepID=A0A3T1D993_9BACL|nr:amidase [Cohnella abietis]BBI34615.1 hypothetical protein KCTCHS21_40140 [Cohnella abietis]
MNKTIKKTSFAIIAISFAVSSLLVGCSKDEKIENVQTEPTPPRSIDVVELGLTGSLALLESGDATSFELTSSYLARIKAYDDAYGSEPGLHAIITVNKNALDEAKQLDEERAAGTLRGPLHGVPLIIKDNFATKDMPTTNGSIAFADYQTDKDATIVNKLREAGAIILAKSNLSEFAWSGEDSISSIRGEVRNPYDQTRTSSGSSGGTAAAISASMGAAGFGSDTYGSIRNPSAHQSLVGVRTTKGLVSTAGITPQVAYLDTAGPMTISVTDAAILLDVVAGYDPEDPYTNAIQGKKLGSYASSLSNSSLKGKKIGFVDLSDDPDGTYAKFADERNRVKVLINQAKADIEAQGATVVLIKESDFSSMWNHIEWDSIKYYIDDWFTKIPANWPNHLAELAEPTNALTLDDYIADGRAIQEIADSKDWLLTASKPSVFEEDVARKSVNLEKFKALYTKLGLDAIVYATDSITASKITGDDKFHNDAWSALASGLGLPVVTVPAGFTSSGLPVGLSLLGLPYSEGELLSYAYNYEQATHHRVAPSSTPKL